MKKLMITTACLIALTGSAGSAAPVEQKDVLLVVLEEANHNRSVHYQSSPHESCSRFLDEFRRSIKEGYPISLTFKEPPAVTGRVLDAFCIRPDGTTETGGSGPLE